MSSSRQLAAIMFTDIVGYTALMGSNENEAFELLRKNREIHQSIILNNHGTLIKELGDGMLVSFPTASEAVISARAIQKAVENIPGLRLRIGIHLGEVVFENKDIFGDGVNIASRIQAITEPGCIYISEAVQNNISNKPEFQSAFVKEVSLKNVKDPVRVYEVDAHTGSTSSESIEDRPKRNSQKSIAVLPFVNMSNDPEQEYFCDGISEEIMSALSQLENLHVVARTSAFSFKGKNLDVREIGKKLNVRNLLEGSVRKSGHKLRITTKLVNAADGTQLWSERYDRVLEDVFSIQENIAENVATSLKGVLTQKEREAIRRPETNINAYEFYLKGRQLLHHLELLDSIKMFEKAIRMDPNYAPAYAGLADAAAWLYEWEGAGEEFLNSAEWNCRKALSLAPELAESHASRGYVLSLAQQYEEAEMEFKKAISLNSNFYDAYYLFARSCFSRGLIRESADLFKKASESRPEDFQSPLLLGQSLRILGNRKEANEALLEGIRKARKQLEINPNDKRVLSLTSGSLFEMGEREEAFEWLNRSLELYPDDAGVLINAACLEARDGNKEKAMDYLETAVNKGFGKKDWIENDPDYDSLREEPRFKALLKRLP